MTCRRMLICPTCKIETPETIERCAGVHEVISRCPRCGGRCYPATTADAFRALGARLCDLGRALRGGWRSALVALATAAALVGAAVAIAMIGGCAHRHREGREYLCAPYPWEDPTSVEWRREHDDVLETRRRERWAELGLEGEPPPSRVRTIHVRGVGSLIWSPRRATWVPAGEFTGR